MRDTIINLLGRYKYYYEKSLDKTDIQSKSACVEIFKGGYNREKTLKNAEHYDIIHKTKFK